jgi:uncharacterized membrane protein required for colicin V production
MNWVDWLIIAILLIGVGQGILRSWVAALLGALVIILAFLAAIVLLPYYGEGVKSLPMPADWARTIAFTIVLIGFYVIFSIIGNTFLGGKRPRLEAQIAGGIVGLGRGIVASMVLVGLLAATPSGELLKRDINASLLGKPLLEWERQSIRLFPSLPPIGPDRKI